VVVAFNYLGSTILVVTLSSTSFSPTRIPVFTDREPAIAPALAGLTQPGPAAAVGAVVDLALYGAPGAGKSNLLYLWLRTLRARAPELDGVEADEQRALVTAALGGPADRAAPALRHAVVHLPAAALLAEVGAAGRLACYGRVGLWRGVIAGLAASLALLVAMALVRGRLDAVGVLAALAVLLAAGASAAVSARARWLDLGEIEIALWDTAPAAGEPAALYPAFEALVRERRRRGAPWRAHAFAPVLVVDPLALGDEPELHRFGRLRSALPVFAALGGARARALVAVSRWGAVEAICRPDRERGDARAHGVTPNDLVSGSGGDRSGGVELETEGAGAPARLRVSREVVRRICLDAEDGREAGLAIQHLRYDAGVLVAEEARESGALSLRWAERTGDLEGDARQSAFRFVASLIDPVAP
jgi:hypothetical protein